MKKFKKKNYYRFKTQKTLRKKFVIQIFIFELSLKIVKDYRCPVTVKNGCVELLKLI